MRVCEGVCVYGGMRVCMYEGVWVYVCTGVCMM